MSVTVVETYTCDGCGATVQRSTGEPLPETWCFLGYVNEPHDEGSLLLCSLCVRGIGFADALKAINDKHHEQYVKMYTRGMLDDDGHPATDDTRPC